MIRRGFTIDLTHILSTHMVIMSCPWALFESKFCGTFSISFSVNVIFDKGLSVHQFWDAGKREFYYRYLLLNHCTNKWSFLLRVSSVNVTKSAGNWRNPYWKTSFFVQWTLLSKKRIKQFGFLFEICNKSIFVENWWNTGYFFITMETLVLTNMFWDLWMVS